MKTEDFLGFRFGVHHTSDLNLKVVSSSNRYNNRMLPSPQDSSEDIVGSDGMYYFGSTFKNREISCNLAFDNVSEEQLRKIRQVFATDKLQDLVFDEEPYKTWKAKLSQKPDFKTVCFMDKDTNQRVYKGEATLNFICYFPYAFGFDKYVVKAADYYMLNAPECIIQERQDDNPFIKDQNVETMDMLLPEDTKYHYNTNPSDYEGGDINQADYEKIRDEAHRNKRGRAWEPNDKTVWKTGFPTYEQVLGGELFFDTDFGEKTILTTRNYWDNVPEWQSTAKLLTTPTLDFQQELMYMPQYSKVDFINTEIGYNKYRPMIGSRILVYNPGDLPIDWEIKINENKRSFWAKRSGSNFRIRRFNVQRLPINWAVDWCGLKTYDINDNIKYKYGNKYFKRRVFDLEKLIENIEKSSFSINKPNGTAYTKEEIITLLRQGDMVADKKWNGTSYLYEDRNTTSQDFYNHRHTAKYLTENSWGGALKVAYNLHLNEIKGIFDGVMRYDDLGDVHPIHCYYAEPIPRQKLGHYIKLFYWQTIQWRGIKSPTGDWTNLDDWKDLMPDDFWVDKTSKKQIADLSHPLINFLKMFVTINQNGTFGKNRTDIREKMLFLDYEDGIAFANRYDELYKLCINESEEFELYWDTLKKLFENFKPLLDEIKNDYSFEDFIYDFINCPEEFIVSDTRDLDYGQTVFNAFKSPEWITEDYIEIDSSLLFGADLIREYLIATEQDEEAVFNGKWVKYDKSQLLGKSKYRILMKNLDKLINDGDYLNNILNDYYYLNSEERMLYSTDNPYGMEFIYKPTKNIMNKAVHKGRWFKLPPGWSLIDIEPVVNESYEGGKRWMDARPFDWGYGGDILRNKREVQQLYDFIYEKAKDNFVYYYGGKDNILEKHIDAENVLNDTTDELVKFKLWYNKSLLKYPIEQNYFLHSVYKKRQRIAEYELLKKINDLWQLISPYYKWTSLKGVYFDPDYSNDYKHPTMEDYDVSGKPLRTINGDISDWWWYACNYLWSNFPPLYWSLADLLNNLFIKYTPLFY